ncbi:DedA family protein [Streptomyces sp. NPDC058612]|uniref:DedA family protein n=1 Tax=Streptomyces sp. NPDC058612 TaxID=3346555 RepID=UPI0036536F85
MNTLTGLIGQVPAPAAYAILAAAVLAESVLLIGAFVPTLTLLLTAGALARTGELNLIWVIVTASCAVVAGDALGHRTGYLLGSRLGTGRLGRRIPTAGWHRADALMARRGGQAVFLTRFLPVLRTLAPHLAGATRMPYRRIAPYSMLAAPLWAGAEAGTGYAAATSVQHAITLGGPALAIAAGLVAAAIPAAARIRRRRQSRTGQRREQDEALARQGEVLDRRRVDPVADLDRTRSHLMLPEAAEDGGGDHHRPMVPPPPTTPTQSGRLPARAAAAGDTGSSEPYLSSHSSG